MTVIDEAIEIEIDQSLEDHKQAKLEQHRKAHIINPPNNMHIWRPGMTSKMIIDIALARGVAVVALCGHKFLPKHNPEPYPSCETCFNMAGIIMREAGE